jgi:hypothetical protein
MAMTVDEKIRQKLYEKQHEEIVSLLKNVAAIISKDADTDGKVLNAIQENSQLINVFLHKVEAFLNSPKPHHEIRVNGNNDLMVSELKKLNMLAANIIEVQNKILESLKKRPTKMKAVRGYSGLIQFVEIIYEENK